jgi:hypothetical protein
MGYNKKKSELPPDLEKMITREIQDARPLIKPSGHTLDMGIVSMKGGRIALDGGLSFQSAKLAAILDGCGKVTLMAVTVGGMCEQESIRMIDSGELTRGVILDAIGSESVEAFADYVNNILAREYGLSGWKPVMRYSPGYGDLALSNQSVILGILDGDTIGIRAHPETYLLDPQKSITAVIGWRK